MAKKSRAKRGNRAERRKALQEAYRREQKDLSMLPKTEDIPQIKSEEIEQPKDEKIEVNKSKTNRKSKRKKSITRQRQRYLKKEQVAPVEEKEIAPNKVDIFELIINELQKLKAEESGGWTSDGLIYLGSNAFIEAKNLLISYVKNAQSEVLQGNEEPYNYFIEKESEISQQVSEANEEQYSEQKAKHYIILAELLKGSKVSANEAELFASVSDFITDWRM